MQLASQLVTLLVAGGLTGLAAREAQAGTTVPSSVVAYTGQIAPQTGGATYLLLFSPTISRDGDVAFRGELTGAGTGPANAKGYWRQNQGGPVELFLRAGSASPIPGWNWSNDLNDPTAQEIGGAIRAGFQGTLTDGITSRTAVWSEPGAPLRNIAVQGGPVPGFPGATFASFPAIFDTPFVETGHLLFSATLTGGGTTSANDFGLWVDDGVTAVQVMREGDDAPGLPPGSKFGSSFFSPPLLADGGVVTFVTSVQVAGLPKSGIWSTHGGSLAPLAIEETQIAGLGAGERIGGFSSVAGNRHGQIAFWGPIENSSGGSIGFGLWISDGSGQLALAYRRAAGPPGLNLVDGEFALSDYGAVYMLTSYLPPTGPSKPGVFVIGPSGWRALARQGDRVPGLDAGTNFQLFDELVVSGHGQVAFRATISGPNVDGSNGTVLVGRGTGQLELVARTGDPIEVAPGIFRTPNNLLLSQAAAGGPGPRRGFSDVGGMVWMATTGGTSSAILVTNLGVPPTVQLVGLEAVQVVQDWNNTIPLVANKATIVRAHLKSDPPTTVKALLRARPAGGGDELPGSPLRTARPYGDPTRVEPQDERGDLGASAFWRLPPSWLQPGALELEVELLDEPLDCLEAAGPVPADCRVAVAFETVPRLQVHLVSIDLPGAFGTLSVDSELQAEVIRRITAPYPIDAVDWTATVRRWLPSTLPESPPCDVHTALRVQRVLDDCREWEGCHRIYFGAMLESQGAGTGGGCAPIDGYVAAGFVPRAAETISRQTPAHEIAHALGREHTVDPEQTAGPDGLLPGFCGERANANAPPFPFIDEINGERRPVLGPPGSPADDSTWGVETNLEFVASPTAVFDLMSYCHAPSIDSWPSRATYAFLRDAIENRFGSPLTATTAGAVDQLLVAGSVNLWDGSATLAPFYELSAAAFPPPRAGSATLRIHRVGGAVEEIPFDAPPIAHDGPPLASPFLIGVASPSTVESIEVADGVDVLAIRTRSSNAPVVTLLSPNGGELLDDETVTVLWSASDADLDPLAFAIQYSADGGASWTTLAVDWPEESFEVARSALAGSSDGRFRIQVSDGLRTATDASDGAVTVLDNAPVAGITSPAVGELYFDGQLMVLEAIAMDPEDGSLAGSALTWSSDRSGVLGTGTPLTVLVETLQDGLHQMTLTVEDSAGNLVTATRSVHVDDPPLIFEDGFESGGTTRWP